MFQELNLEHPPKSIWGLKPRTTREEFDCEVYVHNAKDLWNTPEAISLLVEVAESVERKPEIPQSDSDITLEEARHILLSGVPALIKLLPRSFTTLPSTSSDPLPPPDNIPSYPTASGLEDPQAHDGHDLQPPDEAGQAAVLDVARDGGLADDEIQELQGLQGFFSRMSPWFRSLRDSAAGDQIERAANEYGVPQEVISEQGSRLVQLLQRVIGSNAGDEAQDPHTHPRPETVDQPDSGSGFAEGRESDTNEHADLPEITSAAEEVGPEAGRADQAPPASREEPYDDERNQRWLAGQGMIRLRDFTAQHGTDENAWGVHTWEGEALISEYASRVLQLRHQRTRDFIVNYPLQQGTSAAVRDLVRRQLEREQR